ncbi:RNase adapter RapZ [Flaviflexus massiliensis]|uniref:RNase adapter RapZ n=1 Tax=Flaviflexus massiliensis TaxID=1522309 RepID=UPI0006D5AB15|nr:RNase adapter RapZ [Flaviflexus massiliensis]
MADNDIDQTDSFPAWVPDAEAEASNPAPETPELVIITGMSGAGKSRAAAVLEDLDWYVVDNLPPRLLRALTGLMSPTSTVRRVAVVADVRGREFFAELQVTLDELRDGGVPHRILFLECDDAELVRRYENVRRPHPLQDEGRLLDAIHAERELVADLRKRADSIIDTSNMSVHELGRSIRQLVAAEGELQTRVTVMSFGFKYGLPMDADHVADVRFINNPYWIGELRNLTGHDQPVQAYVMEQDGVTTFVDGYTELIAGILEGYERQLKPNVTIAIGCTGGRHRSVAVAERMAAGLRDRGARVVTVHRDLGRE